ncbi:MAG: hypothetical protein NC310_01160 [Roseburia sp.]|nr:hypothetical protein [Anaeroplasma bactoclasticum]MCM1195662.1 hypothetical protein [Roseburia sp.]MCM1556119.1 hypothetical protein [Anaeroplasma bactoclasticum]
MPKIDIYERTKQFLYPEYNTIEGKKKILNFIKLPSFMKVCYEFNPITPEDDFYEAARIFAENAFKNQKYKEAFEILKKPIQIGYIDSIKLAYKWEVKLLDDISNYISNEDLETLNNQYEIVAREKFSNHISNKKTCDLAKEQAATKKLQDKVIFFNLNSLNWAARFGRTKMCYDRAVERYKDNMDNMGLFWMHLAAIQGHQTAKYFIGIEYERIGDYKEALKWYKDVVEPKNWMIGTSYTAHMSSVLCKKSTTLKLFKEAAEEYCTNLEDIKYIIKE